MTRKMRGILAGNKKAQVTLFIILAIVIVGAILLISSARIRTSVTGIFVPADPFTKLQDCVNSKLQEGINLVSERGGSINPLNGIEYQGNKIEYLCYTNQYYQTCVMQQPLLRQHIERELVEYIKPEADKCITTAIENLRSKGYIVNEDKRNIAIELVPDNVIVKISGLTVTKDSESKKYSQLETKYKSNLYDFAMIATSILNWEARYGDVEITTYMSYYPNIIVDKQVQSDGSKIYTIRNIVDRDKFSFATRSLAWPSGLGIGEIYTPK